MFALIRVGMDTGMGELCGCPGPENGNTLIIIVIISGKEGPDTKSLHGGARSQGTMLQQTQFKTINEMEVMLEIIVSIAV